MPRPQFWICALFSGMLERVTAGPRARHSCENGARPRARLRRANQGSSEGRGHDERTGGVRRVPWPSRRDRTIDSSIDWEHMNGANGGTQTPTCQGRQDPESGVKPINHNSLQHRTALNNKNLMDLQATQIASECCVLLPKTGVC